MSTVARRKPYLADAERNARILGHLPQVHAIARRIHARLPPQVCLADLIQAGVLGLLDAVERFDAARGVQFASYAAFRIRGAIFDSLRELDWGPRELRHKSRQMEDDAARLWQELGRAPSDTELAAAMHLAVGDFQRMLSDISALHVNSLETPVDPLAPGGAVHDVPDTRQQNAFQLCLRGEIHHQLAAAIARLPRKQQQVLALYYFEELTMADIGRVLGVGEPRVSQLRAKALQTLRRRLTSDLHLAAVQS